jgi:hypothetical protein
MRRVANSPRRRRALLLALGAAIAATALLLIPNLASTASPADAKVIAKTTANGFRVTLTAIKGSDGGLPSATVEITAFVRQTSGWQSLGQPLTVGDTDAFFWNVVTGPHSLRLTVATDTPERVKVRLLVTPSIGWSDVYTFHVENGTLVQG